MEYAKKSDLKVECIVSEDDFDFFGITPDDILERTPAGINFLKKAKDLCAITQKVTWTNTAYTLRITLLSDKRMSLEFSERISDYAASLKNSMQLADEATRQPLKEFIEALETSDEQTARELVARFEKNTRNEIIK